MIDELRSSAIHRTHESKTQQQHGPPPGEKRGRGGFRSRLTAVKAQATLYHNHRIHSFFLSLFAHIDAPIGSPIHPTATHPICISTVSSCTQTIHDSIDGLQRPSLLFIVSNLVQLLPRFAFGDTLRLGNRLASFQKKKKSST